MTLEIFSARVREARLAAGLTQTELDALVGMEPGCVAKWEGAKRLARHDSLDKLAEIFNVPVSYFFDGSGLSLAPRSMGRPKKVGMSTRSHPLFERFSPASVNPGIAVLNRPSLILEGEDQLTLLQGSKLRKAVAA